MDPGTLLATTHEAGDGLRVRLRLTRPSDRTLVQDFLDSLAPESREVVRDLTFYDSRRRLVVGAAAPTRGARAGRWWPPRRRSAGARPWWAWPMWNCSRPALPSSAWWWTTTSRARAWAS